jgi:hypothetical protein
VYLSLPGMPALTPPQSLTDHLLHGAGVQVGDLVLVPLEITGLYVYHLLPLSSRAQTGASSACQCPRSGEQWSSNSAV